MNGAGKTSPADAAACKATARSEAGKPFHSTIRLSAERASAPPSRARVSNNRKLLAQRLLDPESGEAPPQRLDRRNRRLK